MAQPTIEVLLRRIASEVRRRRAEHAALRGVFWGAVAGAVVLVFKGPLGALAVPVAAGLLALGLVAGAAWGAVRRVRALDAARVADRAFGLEDRIATTLEWADRAERTPLVEALVADTLGRLQRIEPRRVVRRVMPREARLLPLPVLIGLSLALVPPIPLPTAWLPERLASEEEDRAEDRTASSLMQERSRPLAKDQVRRPAMEERDFAARAGGSAPTATGDLSAIFKDTALTGQRPDFSSFLKKGDERLKLLEQSDRLPDLQSDFTASQYKMVFRKSKALSGGLRPDQISPQKLRELLEEMERLGRKGGNWSEDAAEGMEALEGGQPDRALEAMQRALDKMRAMEERQRSGKGLRGGRDRDGSRRDRGRGGDGGGIDDQDFGEGEGFLPGRGRSPSPRGEASQRLRGTPYDVGVEGEARQGRKDAYDTNLTGRAGPMPSRLQYLGVIGQYRKLMEDAISREQIPRDYHAQIKDYFQALDER